MSSFPPNTPIGDQVQELAKVIQMYWPDAPGSKGQNEGAVDVAIRLLTPSIETIIGKGLPNGTADRLARSELRRLAQYVLDECPEFVVGGSLVDNIISVLKMYQASREAKKVAG